ncbi:MAG: flippase-like domain-containing protein [Candidatus Symbiothrix sp.]|nr:flippase-like domain-containing protein [Candidatus Symbiothrix sp.]
MKKILKIAIPLALGLLILFLLYRKTDFRALWSDIQTANWLLLSVGVTFCLIANLMRGLRWELLIRSLDYHPRRANILYAIMGNYAINFAIPRAGEIWRCSIIYQKDKIPLTKLVETLLIDRISDVFMMAPIIVIAILLNIPVFSQHLHEFQAPDFLTSWQLYVGLVIAALIGVSALILFKDNWFVRKINTVISTMRKDVKILLLMPHKTVFMLYSIGIWSCYIISFCFACSAFAFTAHIGFAAILFVFVMGSISMMIPSNGGLGPWQAATVFGLVAFAVNQEQAIAFATATFTFQSLWLVLCGLFGIIMLSATKDNG